MALTNTRALLTVEEYLAEVLALIEPFGAADVDELPLREAAGRTLAAPVVARGDVPAFANSAMDGFAVRSADLAPPTVLRIDAEVLAGSSADPAFGPGACVRIMTGAPLPTAADAVVPVEQTTLLPQGVRIDAPVAAGQHVRAAGEDVRQGAMVLDAGVRLGARTLSAAAGAGHATVRVVRRPRVGVIATGDELVPPGGDLGRGQIFESNATFLAAALTRDGGEATVLPAVRDTDAALAGALDDLAATCDLVVVSGGVSVGDADVTRIVLERAGARFRHVRLQPGKPQGWARWGARGLPVIALPGNPLSAAVSYETFVAPVLDRFHRRPTPAWTPAVAAAAWSSPAGRRQLVPVLLDVDASGRQLVRPAHRHGSASHMITSLAAADALAAVAEDVTAVAVGDLVAIRRLP
ncbi:gephyrin-like molybdotransferase Glp [Propioniciclava soli]|uniref:molybdopterin molybdotransferase MoeA n=1 Tax=Propioniciclava soli TaxID=2775081 RepID=UPI001E2DF489|nr:gephyrin-like molybdotransferase Glp [Propioniciclava soli]